MADTQPQAPYGGYTGPVRFLEKMGSSRKNPLTGATEQSRVILAMDDQGNVLDSYKTGLHRPTSAKLTDEVNRYKALVSANVSGSPQSYRANYGEESVTISPGASMSDPFQTVSVGEDGSLTIKTIDNRGIRQAPTITTGPETVPLGTPVGASIDTLSLMPLLGSGAIPMGPAASAVQPTYSYAAPMGQQAMTQPQAVAGGIPSLLPQAMARPTLPYFGYTNQFSPINTLTQPGPAGAGEQLMYDQQSGTIPFSYVSR